MESGIIKTTSGDKAIVRLKQDNACKKCAAKIICRPGADGFREIQAQKPIKANIGDYVEIDEIGNFLLYLSVMRVGIPLLGLITGIFLLNTLKLSILALPQELIMSMAGLLGLLIGGFIIWIWSKYKAKKIECVFQIVTKK